MRLATEALKHINSQKMHLSIQTKYTGISMSEKASTLAHLT